MAWSGASGQRFERDGALPGGSTFNGAWSASAWVRSSALPSGSLHPMVNIRGNSAQRTPDKALYWDHPTAGFRRSASSRAGFSSGAYGAAVATSPAATNAWEHFVGTYDGTNVRVYVNGALEATTAIGVSTNDSPTRITLFELPDLSGWASSAQFATGQLAECAVWTAALTADEAASLGKGFRPSRIRPQSLFFYAPLVRDTQDVRGLPLLSGGAGAVTDHPRAFG